MEQLGSHRVMQLLLPSPEPWEECAAPTVLFAPPSQILQLTFTRTSVPFLPVLPQVEWEEFDALRARVEREWSSLPPTAPVISPELSAKRDKAVAQLHAKIAVAQ